MEYAKKHPCMRGVRVVTYFSVAFISQLVAQQFNA